MARPAPDPALVAAVIKAYTTTTATLAEIAEIAEVSPRTVLRWLAAENVPNRVNPSTRTERQDTEK